MEKCRGIIFVLALAVIVTGAALPCPAAAEKEEDKSIFAESEQRGRRPRRGRFELTDEEKDRLMEAMRKRDPKKAREVAGLRKKDPDKFREALRTHVREEYDNVIRDRIATWRQEKRAEFLDWLMKNYRRDARELASLKGRDPDVYEKRLDSMREKYDPIRDAERWRPELAVVLKEDLRLKERRGELIAKIKTTKRQGDKKKLIAELQNVVTDRYDLIVKRKRIAYERLIKRVKELQDSINKSRAEIADARKDEVKTENVKQRMKTLLEGKKGFTW